MAVGAIRKAVHLSVVLEDSQKFIIRNRYSDPVSGSMGYRE